MMLSSRYPALFRSGALVPCVAMAIGSAVCGALVMARIAWTGNLQYAFLMWNLFLAWIPLVLAIGLTDIWARRPELTPSLVGLTAAWLLFFPNAPYIFTDIVHLTGRYRDHFWVDLVIILMCSMTGLVLAFLSLYLVQTLVARKWGALAGWVFVIVVAVLSSFGVYLGRFLRFNTWDVVVRPWALLNGVVDWARDPFAQANTYAFPCVFAVFLLTAHAMLYALTYLRPATARES